MNWDKAGALFRESESLREKATALRREIDAMQAEDAGLRIVFDDDEGDVFVYHDSSGDGRDCDTAEEARAYIAGWAAARNRFGSVTTEKMEADVAVAARCISAARRLGFHVETFAEGMCLERRGHPRFGRFFKRPRDIEIFLEGWFNATNHFGVKDPLTNS